jgi:hypothetical protein
MTVREIAKKVIEHAEQNYSDGTGWDEIVECCGVDDLEREWQFQNYSPRTVSGAIAYQKDVNKLRAEHRAEIRAEIF